MKAFLTGAGGQVGLELIQALVADGWSVVASDVAPRPAGVPSSVPWASLDVTNAAQVDEALGTSKPDVVFHLAAILSATGEKNPARCWDINMNGTVHVLESARKHCAGQVMFASTIAAFGPGLGNPVGNDVSMRPTTMYGVTKVAGELLGEYYWNKLKLDFRGVRFPGLINAGKPGGGSSDYSLHMYVTGLEKGAYTAFCRPDTTIPLMYMPDAIRALIELAKADRAKLTRCIYNIQGFSPTAEQIAASAARGIRIETGKDVKFGYEPDFRQAILDSWPKELDDSAARRDWGWAPRYGLDAMTRDLVPKIRAMLADGRL
ncbi:MAG: putative epimerase/dehydratase [Planctomycetes bacterium]|nr:putative epimerase/dehydratase [Planctomycetota bacterium]